MQLDANLLNSMYYPFPKKIITYYVCVFVHNIHYVSCMSVFHCFTIFVPVLCCVDVVSRNMGARWPSGLERITWLHPRYLQCNRSE